MEKFDDYTMVTNIINPKTGKPFSRQTIWRHAHPEKIEQFRSYNHTEHALKLSSLRTIKNKDRLREVKRKYYQEHKLRLAGIARQRRLLEPEKVKAHNFSTWKYNKKSNCEICGDGGKMEIHHWNYDKPQFANTLCRTCHKIQHVKNFPRWNENKLKADALLKRGKI